MEARGLWADGFCLWQCFLQCFLCLCRYQQCTKSSDFIYLFKKSEGIESLLLSLDENFESIFPSLAAIQIVDQATYSPPPDQTSTNEGYMLCKSVLKADREAYQII